MTELDDWDSFYVIVGSAAGALIGLQFVVVTLVADRPRLRSAVDTHAAFSTPTIVHFAAVLLLSALLRVPWRSAVSLGVVWGVIGGLGIAYLVVVAKRMRKQIHYTPEAEDWAFHLALPFLAYLLLAGSAFAAPAYLPESLFAVGGATLLLLFAGIHNAWDAATFIAVARNPDGD